MPLLFPDRPGTAAGFVGGVSTAAGIVYPLRFCRRLEYPHRLLLRCRSFMFLPFLLFYFWAARYERNPREHGLLSPLGGSRLASEEL